jgi:hypothetical protein
LREEGVYQRKCSPGIGAAACEALVKNPTVTKRRLGGAPAGNREKKSTARAATASFQESSIKRIKVFGCCLLSNFSPILQQLSPEISLVGGRRWALAGAAWQQGS